MDPAEKAARLRQPVSLWRIAVGWALICGGIIGLILPVIPGVPLLIAGLVVLSARYSWAAAAVRWMKRKVRQATERKALPKRDNWNLGQGRRHWG